MSEQADSIIASYAEEGWSSTPLHRSKRLTCKYCGEKGLLWTLHKEDNRMLLGDGKKIHICPVNPYKEKSNDA